MGSRLQLQSILEEILGSSHVYFQPPENVKMVYPAIVYNRYDLDTTYADNKAYALFMKYQVTVVDANPDSEIPGKIAMLPQCSFERHFVSDSLNHDVFNLYF